MKKSLIDEVMTESQPNRKRVGVYELIGTLGEGAFGKVKHGIHTVTRQEVAIKILDKRMIKQQKMESQVKREVSIMKQIGSSSNTEIESGSSHVCQLFEVLASHSKIFLILEICQG